MGTKPTRDKSDKKAPAKKAERKSGDYVSIKGVGYRAGAPMQMDTVGTITKINGDVLTVVCGLGVVEFNQANEGNTCKKAKAPKTATE